ncbi:hypothetical protein LY78DRAFT_137945 [Colletotrichum sublineola]|nr:hypothetical protein LY78DRAFT_137945 [Colletotrichum sublineola]
MQEPLAVTSSLRWRCNSKQPYGGIFSFFWCYMVFSGSVQKGKAAIYRGRCEREASALAPHMVPPQLLPTIGTLSDRGCGGCAR